MSVQLIPIKCPNCDASLNIEEGRKQLYCSYCGAKILVNNENEYIYRTIDEASIKRSEAESALRLKELELEEKENERNRNARFTAYKVAAAVGAIGIIFLTFNINDLVAMFAILGSMSIALYSFLSKQNDNRKHTSSPNSNEVKISTQMIDYTNKKYNSIVTLYKKMGFTNVTAIPLCDLNIRNAKKNGFVKNIEINGESDFCEDDIFPKSSVVIITYHSIV